uniref:Sarcosine oxidasee (formaldehyde-forming) n=1 Tax=Steinernema glaseri TaxID=37863 RepID=A0A1I7Z128_9BILA
MAELLDVVVVGAGIMGSCAAYHSATRGLKPVVLEQFSEGHARGSSHGQSRIIRYAHGDTAYLPLMKESYSLWEALERSSDDKLIRKCGLLWVSTDEASVQRCSEILVEFGIEHRLLPGPQIQEVFPQFCYDEKWFGLVDPEAGVIYAERCLKAVRKEAEKKGAEFRFEEKVARIESLEDRVLLVTDKAKYEAKKVIVTVGAWLNEVLPGIRDVVDLQAEQIGVMYWKVARNQELYGPTGTCPTLVVEEGGKTMYMLPPVDYSNQIKFCLHAGEPIHPDEPLEEVPKYARDAPGEHISKHLPDIDGSHPSTVDKCLYTMTKDSQYAIGTYPSDPRIIVAGGFSGSGFKLSIAVGRILTDLVQGAEEKTVVPELFRLTRKRAEHRGMIGKSQS